MIKRLLLISLVSFLTPALFSQEKDFGLWYEVSTELKLIKKLELDLSTSVRTFRNASKIEEAFFEGGLTYKLNKYLSASGSYRINKNIEDDDAYYIRHKLMLGLTGSITAGRIDLSGRMRFQQRSKTYIENYDDTIPDLHLRYRMKALYNTRSFPLNPYGSAELFCPIDKDYDRNIDKIRLTGGIRYKISKKHSLEGEYIFQRDYRPRLRHDNIIAVNYKLKF